MFLEFEEKTGEGRTLRLACLCVDAEEFSTMSATVAPQPPIAQSQEIPRDLTLWRLSVAQYHEMARSYESHA